MVRVAFAPASAGTARLSLDSLLLATSALAVIGLFVLANALQIEVSPDSHVLSATNLPPGLGDFAVPQPVQQGHLVNLDQASDFSC